MQFFILALGIAASVAPGALSYVIDDSVDNAVFPILISALEGATADFSQATDNITGPDVFFNTGGPLFSAYMKLFLAIDVTPFVSDLAVWFPNTTGNKVDPGITDVYNSYFGNLSAGFDTLNKKADNIPSTENPILALINSGRLKPIFDSLADTFSTIFPAGKSEFNSAKEDTLSKASGAAQAMLKSPHTENWVDNLLSREGINPSTIASDATLFYITSRQVLDQTASTPTSTSSADSTASGSSSSGLQTSVSASSTASSSSDGSQTPPQPISTGIASGPATSSSSASRNQASSASSSSTARSSSATTSAASQETQGNIANLDKPKQSGSQSVMTITELSTVQTGQTTAAPQRRGARARGQF